MNQFLAASAVVPSLLLIWYFRSRDVNPEPGRVVWATFFLGLLTVIPVLLVDSVITQVLGHPADPMSQGFGEAFFVAAMPEEFFKFLVITLYASRHKEFDEPMDGIVYGAVASLGFATLENILYVSQGGIGVAIMRAVTAVPGHAFMGAIAGYYVGQAKFDPKNRWSLLLRGYFYAVLLHGLYDAGLLSARAMARVSPGDVDAAATGGLIILTLAVFVYEWIWSVRLVRKLRALQVGLAAQASAAFGGAMMPMQNAQPSQALPPPQYGAPGYAAQQPQPGAYGSPPAFGAANGFAPPAGQPQYAAQYGSPNAQFAPQSAMPMAAPQSAGVGAWLQLVFGGLLGSVGGLVTLGVIAGIAMGSSSNQDTGNLVIGTAVIGVLPLGLGLFLFAGGVKKISAASNTALPQVAYANPQYRQAS